jgi:hypothetical protein
MDVSDDNAGEAVAVLELCRLIRWIPTGQAA